MNKLGQERRVQVVKALVEGNSINGTVRMTGVAKNTVLKLLADLGSACLDYQETTLRNLNLRYIECDEIWEFCYAKERNVPAEYNGDIRYCDVWTWTGIDADTKLVPCWHVGGRTGRDAWDFIANLRSRLTNRVQLATDGLRAYLEAIEGVFGAEVEYAMLNKIYGHETWEGQRRYSPAECIGADKRVVAGNQDSSRVSISHVERQNLTMRMSMRRFTRLSNGFNKKIKNHMHAISLHFMWYNFACPHKTLSKPYPTTPAMAAGITDHVWTAEEVVMLGA